MPFPDQAAYDAYMSEYPDSGLTWEEAQTYRISLCTTPEMTFDRFVNGSYQAASVDMQGNESERTGPWGIVLPKPGAPAIYLYAE